MCKIPRFSLLVGSGILLVNAGFLFTPWIGVSPIHQGHDYLGVPFSSKFGVGIFSEVVLVLSILSILLYLVFGESDILIGSLLLLALFTLIFPIGVIIVDMIAKAQPLPSHIPFNGWYISLSGSLLLLYVVFNRWKNNTIFSG